MRKTLATCLVLWMGFALGAWAYEVDTHAKLSVEAVRASSLATTGSRILVDFGLDADYLGLDPTNPRNKRISDGIEARTVTGWVEHGSIFEDNDSRPLNHFYDPLRDRGLRAFPAFGIASPVWALEEPAEQADQDFSLKDAREYLYQALTNPDREERQRHYGKTFESLGRVVHHLQDMAQPQHVRNDAHCDRDSCKVIGRFNPSRYEKYTDARRGGLSLINELYTSDTTVRFPKVRDFWASGSGAGMAEHTNRNFLSDGTNFLLLNGQAVANARYPDPKHNGLIEDKSIGQLYAEEGAEMPTGIAEECTAKGLDCRMMFYAITVTDAFLNGGPVTNHRASTLSLFDQYLNLYGKKVTYTDPETGTVYESDRLFSLNSFNFKKTHEFLVPRAAAFSAGLIDYFFVSKTRSLS